MNEKSTPEAAQPPSAIIEEDSIAEEVQVDQADNDGPPDGGYGWIVVFSVFLINCFLWGVAAASFKLLFLQKAANKTIVIRRISIILHFQRCLSRGDSSRLCFRWRH